MGWFVQGFFALGFIVQGIFSMAVISQGYFASGLIVQGTYVSGLVTQGFKYSGLRARENLTWAPGVMTKGDIPRKWLTYFFIWTCKSYILTPNLIFSENYHSMAILLVVLQLVMIDDFGIWVVIISISCHCNDLKSYETTNIAHVLIYFGMYCIHYYVVYMNLFRPFDRALVANNEHQVKTKDCHSTAMIN